MPRKHVNFSNLLYQRFHNDKAHDVRTVAARMNVAPSTLYHWIEGGATFPVDMLPNLYNATKDRAFLDFVLDDTDQMPTPRQAAGVTRSMLEETLDVAGSCGDLVHEVQTDIPGGISELERRQIIGKINLAQKELEDLRQKVNGGEL